MTAHAHGRFAQRDFARTPLNIYWEMTQACALACRHCRAAAVPHALPHELNNLESQELIDQISGFGNPLPYLILTGGDPLARNDLLARIAQATSRGIGTSITPAVTPRLTYTTLAQLRECGLQGVGLSVDGATAAQHDAIRGVPGTFEHTLAAARWVGDLGMPLQINTLVSAETAEQLPAIYELLRRYPVTRWSLFFLIAVGRGQALQSLSMAAAEQVMGWVYETSKHAPFAIGTTEAPSYHRIVLEHMQAEGLTPQQIEYTPIARGFGIRDGHGIMFISNIGEIYPAGFLPQAAGNVRYDDLVTVYRSSELFQQLHQPNRLLGKCGRCEYRTFCGGSRARAFAATGNPLASDPLCSYRPQGSTPSIPLAKA